MKLIFLTYLLSFSLLSNAQRYKNIHQEAIVVDSHNDVLRAAVMRGMDLSDDLKKRCHSDFGRLKQGGIDVQVFSVFCNSSFGKDTAFKLANIEIDSLYSIARRHPDKLTIVKTPKEIRRALNRGSIAGIIGIEGGHMIEDKLQYLDSLFYRGARYLTLTWNNSTPWASSSQDEKDSSFKSFKGLSEFGKNIVRRMNELGMMIDISHVGEQTVADVLQTTTKPILASHSAVYALNPHHRNLKDDQIKMIAKNGGVVQISFYAALLDSSFAKHLQLLDKKHQSEIDSLTILKWSGTAMGIYLKEKYPYEYISILPSLSILLDHIDYIVKLVGVDYVGLGSDFDGMPFSPIELEDVSKFPNITKGLLERGYNVKEINKILGGNFLRVFKNNMK